jgi:transcriptional regulator with XRE-family HTH domain
LKQARLAARLSQKQLGIDAGLDEFVASARINRYEVGIHQPDFLTLTRLAAVLQVPTAYFYAEDDLLAEGIRLMALMSHAQLARAVAAMANLDDSGS